MLYGGMTGHKLAQRAAALLGEIAAEQKGTYDQAKGFYDVRSRIVHGKEPPSLDDLDKAGRVPVKSYSISMYRAVGKFSAISGRSFTSMTVTVTG